MLLDYLSRLIETLLNLSNANVSQAFLQSALKHAAVNYTKEPTSSD